MSKVRNDSLSFNSLFETVKDCVLIFNRKGIIQDINQNGLTKLAYDKQNKAKLQGRHMSILATPKIAKLIHKQLLKLDPQNAEIVFEAPVKSKNREKIEVEITLNLANSGESYVILAILRDISIFHKVASTLDLHGQQYRTLIEAYPHGLIVLDTNGEIIEVNKVYVQQSGYKWEEHIQLSYLDLLFDKNFSEKEFLNTKSKLFQTPHKTKNGDYIPVRTNVTYFKKETI